MVYSDKDRPPLDHFPASEVLAFLPDEARPDFRSSGPLCLAPSSASARCPFRLFSPNIGLDSLAETPYGRLGLCGAGTTCAKPV